ncbi:ATP-binding protein [Pseudomonas aeruginosa]|uniref:ATP-binding protein n=1 Tax=Pseudomonas aeruginosa TaxID=287 RepID=UPI003907FE0B|nr:transcriptional regulator [Pseudomonas aeruginosa]
MRYSDEELEEFLENLESDYSERKESYAGDVPNKARQAICAFANDLPNRNRHGVLFIGVKDNGTPSGIEITDRLLQTLADIKTDGKILPPPAMTVEKRTLRGNDVAVVTVAPSDMPPVRLEGRIWIRTGPRRAIANEQEERILIEKRRYKNIPFDIFPVAPASLSDLSRVIFETEYLPQAFADDVLETDTRTYEERLSACKMIVSPNDTTPTTLGILSIGRSPQDFFPGAIIQFLRIDGNELADPVIDEQEISGTLSEMLKQAEQKLRSHNRIAVDITTMATHKIEFPYPPAALQQALYNAVLHRTYEGTNTPVRVYWFNDRIEIHSPGGPYGSVTVQNFGQPGITDYRNPNVGDVLKVFGFIQAFGRGIATVRKEMANNKNPEPDFIVSEGAIVCVLRGKQ